MGYVPNQQTTILNSVPNITASLLLFCRYGSLWCIYRHPILAIKLNSVYIWWSTMTCSLVHWFWYCEHRQPPSLVIMWHRAGLRDQTRRCAPSHLSVFDPHDTGSHRIKCQEMREYEVVTHTHSSSWDETGLCATCGITCAHGRDRCSMRCALMRRKNGIYSSDLPSEILTEQRNKFL